MTLKQIIAYAFSALLVSTSPVLACQLDNTEWRPIKVGQEIMQNVRQFVQFADDDTVMGNIGCNGFRGNYQLTTHKISITLLPMTKTGCPTQKLNDQQRMFLNALNKATYYERTGTKLVLIDRDGQKLAELLERH